MKIPATDLIPCVTKLIYEKWQQFWNSCTRNKLQAIRPTVGDHQQKSSLARRDEVVINRLRIGHMRCTHSYLLSCADQRECTTCQCPFTVKHILVECLAIFMTNILLLPLWRNCSGLLTYITSLILSKKLIFATSYNFFNIFLW